MKTYQLGVFTVILLLPVLTLFIPIFLVGVFPFFLVVISDIVSGHHQIKPINKNIRENKSDLLEQNRAA